MTSAEAKQILLLYRPTSLDARDSEMAQALELVRHDPDLAHWFNQHCAFQVAMRGQFRQIEPPAGLKGRLLAAPQVIRPRAWWRQPIAMAAAAAIVLAIGLTVFWPRPADPAQFANFQSRMTGAALRVYHMDLETNDMSQVRQFLERKGAPSDYEVTKGLAALHLSGGGVLRWRSNPVSMVCFDRGDKQMLFLFVMKSAALKDPPPETPQAALVNQLRTVSWTSGGKTYFLAGSDEEDFARKYL